MAPNQLHLDAAESAFFDRQLEFIKAKTFDIKYPMFRSRTFIPTSGEVNPGATTVTYRQYNEVGQARIGSHASDHPPRVDINGEEFSRPVRSVEASYGWHQKDIKAAAMAGLDLNPRRASACRKAIERMLDEVAAVGAPKYGIATGALNDANVTVDPSGGTWDTPADPDDIIGEVAGMWQGIISDTHQVETADTLVLPPDQWAHIAVTARSADNNMTILKYLRENMPDLTAIEPWYRMDEAGVASADRAWMYSRNADTLQNEVVQEFEQLPPQAEGFEVVINCWAQTAGVAVYYPLAMRYLDGI